MENQTFEVVGACMIKNEWKPYRKVVTARTRTRRGSGFLLISGANTA